MIFFSSHYSEKMGFLQLVPSCDFLRADHVTAKQKLSICTHTVTFPGIALQSASFSLIRILSSQEIFDHLFLLVLHQITKS